MLTRMGLDSIVHGRISFVRYPHSQTSGQGLQAIKECRIAGISATGKEQRTTNKETHKERLTKKPIVDYVDLDMKTYDIV